MNETSQRPNFIVLVGEDVGLHLACYGDRYASTPNLDRLASQGARYTQAFSTAPVSAPSRSALVTGQHAFSIGSHHMRSTLLNPPRLFTQELRDAGYYVNWENKTDFNFNPPADFTDETRDWLGDLRRGKLPAKPFFLFHNDSVTHESTMWPEPWQENSHKGEVVTRAARLQQLRPDQHHDPADAPVPAYLPDRPQVRADLARYYDALSIADARVGQVLEALDASPYRDNTILIYMSDHGRGLVREKRWCYGAGIHLPLVIRAPGLIKPGVVSEEMVSWVDIAPTVLSLAGVPIPQRYHGQVFLGPDKAATPRRYAYAGRDLMDCDFDRVRACRRGPWHYIRNDFPNLPYAQRNQYMEHQHTTQVIRELHARGELTPAAALWMSETKPPEELYDTRTDPDMVHNLADDPAHAPVLAELRQELGRYLDEVGDLGMVPESELIARGLAADRMDEYRRRIAPLPEHLRLGPPLTLLTMEEALAYQPG
jgi:N-sulfoglucosamine sulfohydrolase